MFFLNAMFLFSQDVEETEDQSNRDKKITPKPPDSFPNGIPSISLEEPRKSLYSAARTTESDLMHGSVLHSHLAEMNKILQKERE